jgi:hypothetical protein
MKRVGSTGKLVPLHCNSVCSIYLGGGQLASRPHQILDVQNPTYLRCTKSNSPPPSPNNRKLLDRALLTNLSHSLVARSERERSRRYLCNCKRRSKNKASKYIAHIAYGLGYSVVNVCTCMADQRLKMVRIVKLHSYLMGDPRCGRTLQQSGRNCRCNVMDDCMLCTHVHATKCSPQNQQETRCWVGGWVGGWVGLSIQPSSIRKGQTCLHNGLP